MSIQKRINDGLSGAYSGLKNGFVDINKYIFGIQKKCYTLIGGASGSYKTTVLDFKILNALIDAESKGIPITIFYYSFEIDEITKKCNWLSQLAFITYGVIIPPEKIKGLGDNRLNDEEQTIINNLIPEVDKLFAKIRFVFEPMNPTGVYNELFSFFAKNGTFLYEDYEDVVDGKKVTKQRIVGYTPNVEGYTLLAMDHLYLMRKERGYSTKENMDKMSEYVVALRNMCDLTAFIIQQFNQGLNAIDRQKFKGTDLSPQQTDFKDTTNPYQDADVVIGIMNAYKMGLETCLGYNIDLLKDKFLMYKIIKNRLSRDNIAKGIMAHPESGRFVELPKAEEFKKNPELYKKYV